MRGFRTRAYVGLRGYSCGRLPQGEICLNPTARPGITDADLGFMKKKTLSDDCLNQQQEKLKKPPERTSLARVSSLPRGVPWSAART